MDSVQRNDNGRYKKGALKKPHITPELILKQIKRNYEAVSESTKKFPDFTAKPHPKHELAKMYGISFDAVKYRLKLIQNEIVGNKTIKEWYKL